MDLIATSEIAKVGLGVASFGALLWFLRWLAGEMKQSRVDFLLALDKRDANMAAMLQAERDHNERQTVGLHQAIDDLGTEVRAFSNGRDRGVKG